MDKTPPTRRDIVSLLGVGLAAGLAGCNRLTDTGSSSDSAGQTGTSSGDADITVSISTESQPAQLPPLWDDHRIEEFQAEFAVATSGGPTQVTVSNGNVEINRESGQWNGDSVTVQPGQMTAGEQEFTAKAQKDEATIADTATAVKPVPGNYKIDVVPERDEELRNIIENNSDEENYLEVRGGFTAEDPVFNSYSSHEQLGFDKLEADLTALEWRHDNDYENLGRPADTEQFIQSIGTDTGNPEIQAVKNGEGTTWYPNGNFEEREVGHFNYEKFANAETLGEALSPLHSYYFNWQSKMTDSGPISSEDLIYAPTLEQAIEQKNNKDLEAHAWDFDLDEHGNGLIYGRNADGSDELRIMETVANPVTASAKNVHDQLHPLVEDSNYLNPDHEEFNRYWHPLRFGWGGYTNSPRWDFRGEKSRAFAAVMNIASSIQSEEIIRRVGVVPTTGYLKDFTEKLRTYNENDTDFSHLHNQSKLLRKLEYWDDNQYVVYGTTANPQYAAVKDFGIVDEIWIDQNGQYDDFDQYLQDNPGTWRPTCLEDGSLRFEADSDYLTPAQNENGKTLEFTLQNQTDCWATIKPYLWEIEQQTENGWTTVAKGENDRERILDPTDEHRWYLSFQEYPGGSSGETHFVVSLDPGTYRLSITVELDDQETTRHVPFDIGN
ncbi:hypothetical protein PNP85_03325 [Halobacterium salinarum]|uniref:hypothetical protein n=1 Tax=Halobacterium salinarum TaxID=2242 RepID=UPI002555D13F|nr:hypothetical protein [Halobacterium salinarum]MDL0135372.1 hypothetical protein [Halobacterium salinarum]MDL0138544.1 hypothetical protein [Halobacterium salinarum]